MGYVKFIDDMSGHLPGTKCDGCRYLNMIGHKRHANVFGRWEPVVIYETWCGRRRESVDPRAVECDHERRRK